MKVHSQLQLHLLLPLLFIISLAPAQTAIISDPQEIEMPRLSAAQSNFPEDNFKELFPEDKSQGKLSGCYIMDPKSIGLEYTKAMVPLKHINYNIEIVNSLAHITLEQEYENPSRKFLNVKYSFPIQPDSSLYKFEAKFGNIIVEGVVKEKMDAKKAYEQAKREGRQVVLVTLDANSKDIINMDIGNIPPYTKVQITISLVQELTIGMNMFYRLQVPSTISPRYLNSIPNIGYKQIPAASTLSTSALGQQNNPDYNWEFSVSLRTSKKILFLDSPSHDLLSSRLEGDMKFRKFRSKIIPNKDFVFVYTPEDFELPNYVVGESENTTTVLASFIPRFSQLKPEDAYQKFKENKEQQFSSYAVRGEYIFLLDRSGSMRGKRIEQAKKALIMFLRSLPPDSYYNIISFGSTFTKLSQQSIRYRDYNVEYPIYMIQRMTADLGGTQIYYPLYYALTATQIRSKDLYPRFVFLLTDGSVSETENVILMAKRNSRFSRIFTIGIGNGASLRLIEGCAEVGRGKYTMISDDENPNSKIISLLKSSMSPVIQKITLNYDSKNLESVFPNPKTMSYILKDNIVNFYFTYRGKLKEPIKISLEYVDPITKNIHRSEVMISNQTQTYPFVDKMAHFKVLRTLEDLSKDSQIYAPYFIDYRGKVADYNQQAINYSLKYQILSQYTSFVAVGKELVDIEKNRFKWLGSQRIEVEQTKPVQYKPPQKPSSPFLRSTGPTKSNFFGSTSFSAYAPYSSYPQSLQSPSYPSEASPEVSSTSSPPIVQSTQPETFTIDDLLYFQSTTGAWRNKYLIKKMAKNPAAVSKLAAEIGEDVVITKLALLWIEKQQVDSVYSLIIQKAEEWLAKKISDEKIDQSKLKILEAV